jgi:hypothetical protein
MCSMRPYLKIDGKLFCEYHNIDLICKDFCHNCTIIFKVGIPSRRHDIQHNYTQQNGLICDTQ